MRRRCPRQRLTKARGAQAKGPAQNGGATHLRTPLANLFVVLASSAFASAVVASAVLTLGCGRVRVKSAPANKLLRAVAASVASVQASPSPAGQALPSSA